MTTGVGVAAVGVAAVAPPADASGRVTAPDATPLPAGANGSLVAHVADVRDDTVTLLVGEREVVVRDADLVARLTRAAWEG